MASEPIREQLMAAVAARLAGLTEGTTYWFTPGEVGRDWKYYDEVKAYPFYGVIEGEERAEDLTNEEHQETFTVTVIGWIDENKAGVGRRIAINRAIGDIKRAVFSDDTWGGIALYTRAPQSNTDQATLFARPYGYFEISFPIVYDHARTAA